MADLKSAPFYLSDEDIAWVDRTIAGMTQDEKIAQGERIAGTVRILSAEICSPRIVPRGVLPTSVMPAGGGQGDQAARKGKGKKDAATSDSAGK